MKIIDLHFLGLEKAIASFLVESNEGPILIETGPHSTISHLEKGLADHGYSISDVKHVFITHIHLDHAGAAWAFADHGAKIYLHPFGKKHLSEPSKLMSSAKLIYQDQMDTLWGQMKPIAESSLITVDHQEIVEIGEHKFESLHTPGHAKHHTAWALNDNFIFTGDVAGVKIEEGPAVAPCPPPDINIEDWKNSLKLIIEKKPQTLFLTHFGPIENPNEHLHDLSLMLDDWAFWIKNKLDAKVTPEEMVPLFKTYTANQLRKNGVEEMGIKQYEAANPSWMSVSGLIRYWKKKELQ